MATPCPAAAAARDSLERHLIELECLVHTLNEPDDAPDIAFVLDCMVDRLRTRWEELVLLINGGMGDMSPMATNEVDGSDSCRGPSIGVPDA